MEDQPAFKLAAFALISLFSLFASTLPIVSRRVSYLRLPSIVFFILKHFGTGVILSTAFVHLLQDAFETLLRLPPSQSSISHWVGLIILAALLTIFLIEYVSITYVERLEDTVGHAHSHQFDPSTHHDEHEHEHEHTHPQKHQHEHTHTHLPSVSESPALDDTNTIVPSPTTSEVHVEPVTERTHLLRTASTPTPANITNLLEPNTTGAGAYTTFPTMHHHGFAHTHTHTHAPAAATVHGPAGAAAASVPVFFSGHHRFEPTSYHASHSSPSARVIARRSTILGGEGPSARNAEGYFEALFRPLQSRQGTVHARRRGSSTSSELGLGHGHGNEGVQDESGDVVEDGYYDEAQMEEEVVVDNVGHRRQVINTLILQIGIMVHSIVIGLTLSIKSGPEFTSLVVAIFFHQLFEGLSLGVRIAALFGSSNVNANGGGGGYHRDGYPQWALAALFATGVPSGGLLGRLTLVNGKSSEALQLTQGLMSALSAGTLIYAATVELLAADFVADPQLKRGSVRRQVYALVSLFAGVGAMTALA